MNVQPKARAKKISVIHLIGVHPNKLGAMEAYSLAISRSLLKDGHDSMVGFLSPPPPWMQDMFSKEGVDVVIFNPRAGTFSPFYSLRQWIRSRGINIVHVTFHNIYSPLFFAAMAGTRARLVYSDQNSRITRPAKRGKSILRFLKNRLIQRTIHAIVADAEFIRDWRVQYGFARPEKVEVIYNGTDLERFRKATSEEYRAILDELGIPDDAKVVVSIAQLIPHKGLDVLLEAAEIVIEQRKDVYFLIVGDGPDRASLKAMAAERGIGNRVHFLGPRVDTERFLGAADIFVLLSVWEEAFAFSLLEAMAAECAIVATRIGAIPESVVDGRTGLLVSPRDAAGAAEAIMTLLGQDDLRIRMGRAGRDRVAARFTLDRWVEETIQLYERLLGAA